jgi:hypothetical protein
VNQSGNAGDSAGSHASARTRGNRFAWRSTTLTTLTDEYGEIEYGVLPVEPSALSARPSLAGGADQLWS